MTDHNTQSGYPGPAYGQDKPPPTQMAYSQPPPSQMGYNQPNMGGGTTVVINQPMPGANDRGAPRMWRSGICGCFDDCGICLCGTFCAPCLTCSVATDMGESCCVPFCVPGAEIVLRTKWRTQENIQGSILDDCCTVWCFSSCAMCQLAREVKAKKNGLIHPVA